ncbi:hypothetical protein [Candidatus Absconditicoccus praedator]|uniref:hypothetical protein n=1 Tax=Candidatus Absconditicoccus praedator TaxID=2735562 RepID=UPI001E45569F|nr:hypothetical protein [Candidatus Absconditicoccus praedator]UFX82888.1 hypothetical protein HLG78_02015 [Candidatus Absconditicoccus praedator]
MRLKDFFDKQARTTMSQSQKYVIYHKILQKQEKKSIFSRLSFYAKVSAYSLVIVGISLAIYLPGSQQQDGYIVGNVQSSEGEYSINRDGSYIEDDSIYVDDVVLLSENSRIELEVGGFSYSTLEGPATINVGKTKRFDDSIYTMDVKDGKSFHIATSKEGTKDMILRYNDIQIQSKSSSSDLDLAITSDQEKYQINNYGEEVLFNDFRNPKFYALGYQQKANIGENVEKSTTEDAIKGPSGSLNNLASQDYKSSKDNLSSAQLRKLSQFLHHSFVGKDISYLVESYFEGNDSAFEISYENFNYRIENVYDIFEFERYSSSLSSNEKSIEDMFYSLDQLLSRIKSNYNIPSSHEERLKVSLAWLYIMKSHDYGKFSGQDLEFENIFDKLNISSYQNVLTFR